MCRHILHNLFVRPSFGKGMHKLEVHSKETIHTALPYRRYPARMLYPPAPIQLLNKLMKIFPEDGLLKTGQVNQIWYHPDYLEAGKLLWQEVRHRENKFSSNLLVSFDPSSSKLQQLFNFGKLQPATRNNLMLLAAPKNLNIHLAFSLIGTCFYN